MDEEKATIGDDREKIIFRANIWIIHLLYNEIVRQMKERGKKFKQITDDCLYSILKTQRSKFSQYQSGQITNITKAMKELYVKYPMMEKVLEGKELINLGGRTLKEWNGIFNSTNKFSEAIAMNGMQKSVEILCKQELEKCFKNVDFDFEKVKESTLENQVTLMLAMEIVKYCQHQFSPIDTRVMEAYRKIGEFDFKQLADCTPNTIKEIYEILRNQRDVVDTLYKYHKYKGMIETSKNNITRRR